MVKRIITPVAKQSTKIYNTTYFIQISYHRVTHTIFIQNTYLIAIIVTENTTHYILQWTCPKYSDIIGMREKNTFHFARTIKKGQQKNSFRRLVFGNRSEERRVGKEC